MMKKNILFTTLLVSILLFVSSCATIEDYTIDGNTVWINDEDIGRIAVSPHTCHTNYCCQYADITSYIATQDLDVAFRFDVPVTGRIYNQANVSHSINNWTEVCDGEFYVPENDTYVDNCTWVNNPYESWYVDWNDVTPYMEHTEYNDKHYYVASDVNFVQDREYEFKWCYNAPNQSGKWDLLAKRSSDSIQEAFNSGNFVMLDPWWDVEGGSLNNGLQVYYSFDHPDDSASKVVDVVSGTYNLTGVHGTPSIQGGKVGNCSDFAGTSGFFGGDWFDDDGNNKTIAFWLNYTGGNGGASDIQPFITKYDGSFVGWFFISLAGVDGAFRYAYLDSNQAFKSSTGLFKDGNWHHIVLVIGDGKQKLYINGTMVAEDTEGIENENSDSVLGIGLDCGNAACTTVDYYLNGSMDEIGIWNRTLTNAEILGLYNGGDGLTFALEPNDPVQINSVNINPTTPTKNDELNCSVNYTTIDVATLNANFTWLKDGVSNYTFDEWVTGISGGTGLVYYSPTHVTGILRDENWTCVVYLENSTDSSENDTLSSSVVVSTVAPTFDYELNWSDYHNVNISLDYNCSDADGDPINYTILNITENFNTNLTINISTGEIFYNPVLNETGERLFNVTCSDGTENTTSELNITILNRPPTIPTTSPANNTYFANYYNLTCNTSVDPESDTIYYQFWNATTNLQNSTSENYLLDVIGDTSWRCRACDYVDDSQSYAECSNYTGYQTTTIFSFANCTGGNVSLFMTYKDEDTAGYIDSSLKANLQLTSSGVDQEFLFDLPVASNHSFCLNGKSNTTIVTGMFEYVNTSYDIRNYYFCNAPVTQTQQNLTLYLLPQELASGITFTVVDGSGLPLPDRTIYVERYNVATNSYTLVAMGKTDTNGQDVIFLRGGTADTGDAWYRFKVYYSCALEQITEAKKITTLTETIRISSGEWASYISEMEGIYTTLSFDNATHTFRLDYSVASGLQKTVCMDVDEQRSGGAIYNLSRECQDGVSGTMTYALPTITNTYKATAYAHGSPEIYLDWLYWTADISRVYGDNGLLLGIGIIAVLIAIGAMIHPIAAVGFAVVGVVGVSLMRFIILPPELVITLIGLAAFVIVLLAGRER